MIDALRRNGLDASDRLILQSFDEQTLRALARDLPSVPRVFLMERAIAERWLSPARLKEAAAFVSGIGPAKQIIEARPEIVKWAHDAGLTCDAVHIPRGCNRQISPAFETKCAISFSISGLMPCSRTIPDQFPAK